MRILITGGCGFIGSNLAEKLSTDGYSVTVFDNLSTGNINNIKGLGIKFYNKPYSQIASNIGQVDTIFHLGIPSSSPMYKKNPKLVGRAINGAIDIFRYAHKIGCKVVYASSSSLYNGNKVPYREDMPIYVTDYYTECRYAIERLARLYNQLHGLKSVGLRFFSVYGPKEKHKGEYANIVSQFLWSVSKGEKPVVFGDGTQTRDFVYVDDAVEALLLAMKKDSECEVFNVGTGVAHSFNQVIDILSKILRKNIEPAYEPNPIENYVHHTLADTTKVEEVLQFKSKTMLETGIAHIVNKDRNP